MPRKRIIDPSFWADEEISQWSYAARLFYIGLWNFADDEGRFRANENLLKASIFPYDSTITPRGLIEEISSKVLWYEHENQKYGYLPNFLKWQKIDRPTLSKLPPPPPLDEYSTNTRRGLDPNISKGNISKASESKFNFEEIWSKYPNRIGKDKAKAKFLKTVKTDMDFQNIQTALTNYMACKTVKNGYIQNGSTWFNQWQDWINYEESAGATLQL